MADAINASPSSCDIPFITFSAANDAAILLLELIQAKASPPNLVSDETSIGFHLSLPLESDTFDAENAETASAASSETDSDAEPGSNLITWRIGSGMSPAMVDKGLTDRNPSILLCPPGSTLASQTIRQYIKDAHAEISFHSKSGVLMLKTLCNRSTIYEQGDMNDNDLELGLDEWGHGMTCVLRRERNYINIGPYRFLLKFVPQSRATYRRITSHINASTSSEYHNLVLSRLFNFIPMASPYNTTKFNVWLHQKIPTTKLVTGVNIHTGQPVAVKVLSNRHILADRRYVVSQLKTALHYNDEQESKIFGILDVWCDHQTPSPCLFHATKRGLLTSCRHTYYSMPLASYNFLDAPWMRLSIYRRLLFCCQTLSGLAELHRQQKSHGNIQPGSLLIIDDTTRKLRPNDEPFAAKKAVFSLDMRHVVEKHPVGTLIHIAPEIWRDLDMGILGCQDGTRIDIWAIACSWLHAFTTPSLSTIVTQDDHQDLWHQMDETLELQPCLAPFISLCRRMTAWDPRDRPTAEEALASDAWQLVQATKQNEADQRKNKRKAKMQSNGVKRVRVLSPEEGDYRVFES